MRSRRPHICLLMLALCGAFWAGSLSPASARARPAAAPPVPPGFVGMMVDGPLFPNTDPAINLAEQLRSMVASGVESLRLSFDWSLAQPYPNWQDVPAADKIQFEDVGGIPTRFGSMDQIVGLAAADGLSVLPVVLDAPAWDGTRTKSSLVAIPRTNAPYANFVKALVRRYGPHGSFWANHSPRVPIRMWQIWNEPNVVAFWPKQPFVKAYVSLLRSARTAIKSADRGAKIVLAGLPNFSWVQLARIYKVRGARGLFDVVAIHPYTRQPQGVITILGKARAVMNAAGDTRKPIFADEVSWPSSLGKTDHNVGLDFATTEAGQARNLGTLLPLLGKDRISLRLLGFYYYTWAGDENHNGLTFDFAGLFRFSSGRFISKPAFGVFRRDVLALEKCRQKASVATRCLKPA